MADRATREQLVEKLVFATGKLITATDSMEQLRSERQAALDAMTAVANALMSPDAVRETLSDCAEFLSDIDGGLARRCESAIASLSPPNEGMREALEEARFWLVLQEPGCVPERKGPWLKTGMASVLRDFMKARPTAYIHVLTVDESGVPWVDHGPEKLQMLDARSMGTGRKHNESVSAAHATAPRRPLPNG